MNGCLETGYSGETQEVGPEVSNSWAITAERDPGSGEGRDQWSYESLRRRAAPGIRSPAAAERRRRSLLFVKHDIDRRRRIVGRIRFHDEIKLAIPIEVCGTHRVRPRPRSEVGESKFSAGLIEEHCNFVAEV